MKSTKAPARKGTRRRKRGSVVDAVCVRLDAGEVARLKLWSAAACQGRSEFIRSCLAALPDAPVVAVPAPMPPAYDAAVLAQLRQIVHALFVRKDIPVSPATVGDLNDLVRDLRRRLTNAP